MNVSKTAENVVQSRAGGRVQRCHFSPYSGSYSIAEHSWGVAMLMHYLWPEHFSRLSLHCLSHDVAEFWTGDIPAPVKRYVPGLRDLIHGYEEILQRDLDLPVETELSEEDLARVKACDGLEFYIWSREQLAMGNQMSLEGLQEIERYFLEERLPDRALALYEALKDRTIIPHYAGTMKEICSNDHK